MNRRSEGEVRSVPDAPSHTVKKYISDKSMIHCRQQRYTRMNTAGMELTYEPQSFLYEKRSKKDLFL